MSAPRVRDSEGRRLFARAAKLAVRSVIDDSLDPEREAACDALEAHLDDRATALAACRAENERLREAIETALGYYQTTHVHAVLRRALTGDDR